MNEPVRSTGNLLVYYTIISNFYYLEKIKKFALANYERKTLGKSENLKKVVKKSIYCQVRTKGLVFEQNLSAYFQVLLKD